MTQVEKLHQINQFEQHYQYDSTYIKELLETSPQGYEKFSNMQPLALHQELLRRDDFWVTKLAAMKAQDCGACLQLNVKMALEAGVDKETVSKAIKSPERLKEEQYDLYCFAQSILNGVPDDLDLVKRIESRYSKGQLLEIGIAVSTASIFPMIKRAVGYTRTCSIIEIKV